MKVLVCGGRDFTDRDMLYEHLDVSHAARPITLIIHGDARGADTLAKEWAISRGEESWELDALEPRTLISLIQAEIDSCRDQERWDDAVAQQEANRSKIMRAASVLDFDLEGLRGRFDGLKWYSTAQVVAEGQKKLKKKAPPGAGWFSSRDIDAIRESLGE